MENGLRDKSVLVVGAGESGLAAARLLEALSAQVTIVDQKEPEELAAAKEMAPKSVEWLFGEQPDQIYQNTDLVVVSPGVAYDHPGLVAARDVGRPVIGEMELAFRFQKLPIIAITGSNGKTTSTSLVGHILTKSTKESPFIGGNIGNPLANLAYDFVNENLISYKWAVIEVSSFQLETVDLFKANAAAFLNLTPDHLDRHGDMAEYFRAKCRIFQRQTSQDLSVINEDDPLLAIKRVSGRRFGFSRLKRPGFGGYVAKVGEEEVLYLVDGSKILAEAPWSAFQLTGVHNQENVLAAVGLTLAAGVKPDKALEVAKDFAPGDHRLKFVAEINGVRYYDDSKGTNVGAVARALDSFPESVILIAGGRGKGLDFSYLWPWVKRKVNGLVLIGESREKMRQALGGAARSCMANSMEDAVIKASELASPGEIVLLSPACASFDMFKNYKERGEAFVQAVKNLTKKRKKK